MGRAYSSSASSIGRRSRRDQRPCGTMRAALPSGSGPPVSRCPLQGLSRRSSHQLPGSCSGEPNPAACCSSCGFGRHSHHPEPAHHPATNKGAEHIPIRPYVHGFSSCQQRRRGSATASDRRCLDTNKRRSRGGQDPTTATNVFAHPPPGIIPRRSVGTPPAAPVGGQSAPTRRAQPITLPVFGLALGLRERSPPSPILERPLCVACSPRVASAALDAHARKEPPALLSTWISGLDDLPRGSASPVSPSSRARICRGLPSVFDLH